MLRAGIVLVFAAYVAITLAENKIHKICVPSGVEAACRKMSQDAKQAGINIECVSARDRIDCIQKVKDHAADFEALEPEDMYIASTMDNEAFSVFKEIRTKEEPDAEFRYEAVAVIHKDLAINDIGSLKGLKSCHTGVGRNVGYKIPITKLTQMGILGPLSDTSLSPRENELKALSEFFSKACLVGTWSPHPQTNARLKRTYSNLCELCQHPEKCDYPDDNSGYEGALRCLAAAGGDVAWTKVIYVKKFFGLAYGTQKAGSSPHSHADFAYLCPDGSKRPILATEPPCTWAARPWPGYMTSTQHSADEISRLQSEIKELNNLGERTHSEWLAKVLLLNNKTLAVDRPPISPLQYLEKAKYKDVIERDVLKPSREVRICVENSEELEKCKFFKMATYSRDIRPRLGCVLSKNCLHSVHAKEAELVILDPHQAITAQRHKLTPILYETYSNKSEQDIVAGVLRSSPFSSIEQLKGRKACLPPNDSAGFFGVIKYLLESKKISKSHCPYEKTLSEFFSNTTCVRDPLQCLEEGKGDVAFVPISYLYQNINNNIEVLCPSGKADIHKALECGLVTIPPKIMMTCPELTEVQIDEARQSMLSAANLYAKQPELFLLFGKFNGKPNVLFSDHADGLAAISDVLPSFEKYKKLVSGISSCSA